MKLPFGIELHVKRTERGWFVHSDVMVGSTVRIHARGTHYWIAVPHLALAVVGQAVRDRFVSTPEA